MASYNAWNGVPMTVNPILKEMVAGEWGVNGIVSTDAGAVHNMVTKHRYFPDIQQAVAACVKNGVNQFLDGYQDGLREALESKAITESDIDAALRGKFRVVLRLGLLDPPGHGAVLQIGFERRALADRRSQSPGAAGGARKYRSTEERRRPAAVGSRQNQIHRRLRPACQQSAAWACIADEPPYTVSPLDGLRKKLGPGVKINMGAGFMTDIGAAAKSSDVAIVFVGNDPTCNRASIIANFDSDNSLLRNAQRRHGKL